MGIALYDLEDSLRSKQVGLSSQEENVLMKCKANAFREFKIGAAAAGAIAWFATRRLPNLVRVEIIRNSKVQASVALGTLLRIDIALGAAFCTGVWRFSKSLDSGIEQILSMDGSRMQNELANIMLKNYPNDPITGKLISKRFYREDVFDDSASDMPKSWWRFRNLFVENAAHPQKMVDHEPFDRNPHVDSGHKPVSMSSGFVVMEDPLDCAFGAPSTIGEIHHPAASTTSCKKHSRRQRRSLRRHHIHNQ